MARILVVYSSTDGHTLEICQRLQAVLELQSHRVTLWPLADGASLDLAAFDKIVLGASIRYGSHGQQVLSFARHNAQLLGSKPSTFFSVNLVARKREKCWPQSNPYLLKFLRQISWQPKQLAVFAGKIDYPILRRRPNHYSTHHVDAPCPDAARCSRRLYGLATGRSFWAAHQRDVAALGLSRPVPSASICPGEVRQQPTTWGEPRYVRRCQ